MIARIEDWAGRGALMAVFAFFAIKSFYRILAMTAQPWAYETWLLDLMATLGGFVFLILVVGTTLFRLPARNTAQGWEPRFSAIAGTFATMLLIVMPAGQVGAGAKMAATALIILGNLLSIYCLAWLGRSFSVMAHARRLVTAGPYRLVRHPLYASEMVTLLGIMIANFSLWSVLVTVVTVAFQVRRMHNEERVLTAAFPEYVDYRRAVPMLVPVRVGARIGQQG